MSTPPPEPIFDLTPQPFGTGPVAPVVHEASVAALRQRSVNFSAKRMADMLFVSGLDRATANRHFRLRPITPPAGLDSRPPSLDIRAELEAAFADGRIVIEADAADRRVTVRWPEAGIAGHAVARPGYGGILCGASAGLSFEPRPLDRPATDPDAEWPSGNAVNAAPMPAAFAASLDRFMAQSPGVYGVLVARPDRVLAERYSAFGQPGRATPSWSMTKAMTCTVIGRLVREGWLQSVHDPAPAPLWRDPRAIHRLITVDHLLRMRSGLGFPVRYEDGSVTLGFENSAVYHDAGDAFEAAQHSLVATIPGSVFRYVNSGINVLGAVIRDQIERRGLPYHRTVYALLADRIGMASYQHSADVTGNLIASGSGFATLRDYARLGALYLNDGVWDGERLLPEGWADYALTATHTGTSYAACFRTNADRLFPAMPEDLAWASGASDQRIFLLRRHRLTMAIANETDFPIDLAELNRLLATTMDCFG